MWQQLFHRYLKAPYKLNTHEYRAPKTYSATVILIHGIGSSYSMWDKVVSQLPTDVRIIAVDLLGFGSSPKPTWDVYNVRTQADSIVTTLFRMRIFGPIVVVGHSLGSLVAIEFARRYPLMTKSLVLISPPLYKPDRSPKTFEPRPEELLRRMYTMMSDNPEATEKVLRYARHYRLINTGFNAELIDVPSYLKTLKAAIINQHSYGVILKIKHPIHILSGRLDAFVLDETIRELTRLRKNITWNRVFAAHEITGKLRKAVILSIHQAIDEAATSKEPVRK